MAWSTILALCVPLAMALMAWIFYLKRAALTHCDFSLGIKGIYFAADFAPPADTGALPRADAPPRKLIITDSLLDKPAAKKLPRPGRGSGHRQNPPRIAAGADKNMHS